MFYENIIGIFSCAAGALSLLIGLGALPGTRDKKYGSVAAYKGQKWDKHRGSKIMVLCGLVMIGLGVAYELYLKK